MKIFELFEKRVPNPFKYVDYEIFNKIDDIESYFFEMIEDYKKNEIPADPLEAGKFLRNELKKFTYIGTLNVNDIILTEPTIDLNYIRQGKTSTELPHVGLLDNKYYVLDGNHRIISLLIQKKDTVKANILNLNAVEEYANYLDNLDD